jgi:hypothetical protein
MYFHAPVLHNRGFLATRDPYQHFYAVLSVLFDTTNLRRSTMGNNFRIRIKTGDHEIEIESSDKEYVDSKLKELAAQFASASPKRPPFTPRRKPKEAKETTGSSNGPGLDVPGFVAQIKDSDDYSDLEQNIIDKPAMLPKLLMCMHFAKELSDDPYLTTGQIQAITDQLGIKIHMANVGKAIKSNQKHFTAKTARKRGQAVPYKLNRNGEAAFQRFLKGEKS